MHLDDIAVVTINWNGWQMTLDCLSSLRASRGVSWRLYIVDNASTDDSVQNLRELGSDVVLLESPINGGWTGGNNLGIRRALQDGYSRIFILNNDALVEPDTMAQLLLFSLSRQQPPIIGPLHSNREGSRLDFIGSGYDAATGLPTYESRDSLDVSDLPEYYPASFVKGAGMFITRDHIERIGFFDERYYLNYDETDRCYKAKMAGIDNFMLKAAKIRHRVSASMGGMNSPLQIYFMARNGLLFVERHSSLGQRLAYIRKLFGYGRSLTGAHGAVRRVCKLAIGTDRRLRGFRAGVRDYLLRRFGDCPAEIRAL
jgi:GT2 family glycosyltransferase